jgi:hypothetical protein
VKQIIGGLTLVACCAIASARVAHAQETINYASVSGRVIDPQGAAVGGAQVSARQMDTNVTAEAVTDSEGRFRGAKCRACR